MALIAVDKLLLELEFKATKATTGLKNVDEVLTSLEKKTDNLGKSGFNMGMKFFGMGMGLLFTGMALKRFGETLLRDWSNVFMTLADEMNAGVKRTLELQAATQFLKFVLFDTFANTELYGMFVEFIVNLINAISEFVQTHPGVAKFIATFLLLAIVIGSLAMPLGQIVLLAIGLSMWLGISFGLAMSMIFGVIVLTILLVALWTSDLSTSAKIWITIGILLALVLFTLWEVIGAVAILAAAWFLVGAIADSNLNPVIKLLLMVGVIMAALIGTALVLGFSLSLPFIIVAAVIGVVIAAFVLMVQRLGSVSNAFKAFGIFLLAIFAAIGDAIYEVILLPLRAVITIINGLIAASNRLLGTNFQQIAQPEAFGMSKKVWEMRNNLLNDADQEKIDQAAKDMELGDKTQDSFSQKIGNAVVSAIASSNLSVSSSTEQ